MVSLQQNMGDEANDQISMSEQTLENSLFYFKMFQQVKHDQIVNGQKFLFTVFHRVESQSHSYHEYKLITETIMKLCMNFKLHRDFRDSL